MLRIIFLNNIDEVHDLKEFILLGGGKTDSKQANKHLEL